jgi:hypothetical protein
LSYLHPIIGAAVLVLLAYVASLGFRLRTARRDRGALAARHARLAPLMYWAAVVSWGLGLGSMVWLRDDLEVTSTLHFRTGCVLVVLLTASALTSRALQRGNQTAREVHPWLGAAAVLTAAIHLVAGLRMMP